MAHRLIQPSGISVLEGETWRFIAGIFMRRMIGIEVPAATVPEALEMIQQAEGLGIDAAWFTTGGAAAADNNIRRDSLSILAAASVRTKTIKLGTAIVLSWPRHPLALVESCQVMAQLAPGRFRLGVGPGNKTPIERTYGYEYKNPLSHLQEYVHIIRRVLREGAVDFKGRYYHAETAGNAHVDIPVMISAVRKKSFELAGSEADGAISWICPGTYLRDVALPAMRLAAENAGRPMPALVAHAAVCVHENWNEVEASARERFGSYMRRDPYVEMFTAAGFSDAKDRTWSTAMLRSIVFAGREAEAAGRLNELFSFGVTEIMVSPLGAGKDKEQSQRRTLEFLGRFARSLEKS